MACCPTSSKHPLFVRWKSTGVVKAKDKDLVHVPNGPAYFREQLIQEKLSLILDTLNSCRWKKYFILVCSIHAPPKCDISIAITLFPNFDLCRVQEGSEYGMGGV
jgi:hypothetical protein